MAHVVVLGALTLSCACAGRARPGATAESAASDSPPPDAMARLERQSRQRDARIRQLENRVALMEAEARELRHGLSAKGGHAGPPRQTIRIGAHRRALEAQQDAESRPLLRSHGGARAAEPLPPVPRVFEKLPLAAVPAELPSQRAAHPAGAEALYAVVLEQLRSRDFEAALASIDQLLAHHAQHALVAKALYWRGEALFALERYAAARDAFEASLARAPRGDKAAQALLKVGLCHRQLGSPQRAAAVLERLKSQFPNSDAARLVSREDA